MRQSTSTAPIRGLAVIIALYLLVPAGVFAQQPGIDAVEITNQAIAKLAAWQNTAAREILERHRGALASTPEFKTAWALLEIQDYDGKNKSSMVQGQKSLSQLAATGTTSGSSAFLQGESLYLQGKKGESEAAWQKAANLSGARIASNPTDATAQFYRGASLVRLKKFEEARTALRIAVRGGFDEAMVNHQIGLSYMFSGQWAPAKDAFDLGLSVNPQYAPMYFWRGMAWEKLGRKDNMLIDLDQFVKLAPNSPEAGKARTVLKSAGR